MTYRRLIIILVLGLYFMSCEDVIEIELNSVEPKIVIEAKLYDKAFPVTVFITKTSDFFDTLSINTVSGAEVIITDNFGKKVNIPETDTAGIYSLNYFGEIGKIYTLTVLSEGEEYTATAEMKASLKIDSLSAKYHGEEIPYFQTGYELTCHIQDSINIDEYALINVYQNLEKLNQIYLFEDTYTDGLGFDLNFYGINFLEKDTAIVEVLTCDRGVYDYLYTYAEIAGNFFDSGTPYNPTTNISNDALGYFGVFSVNGGILIIE